ASRRAAGEDEIGHDGIQQRAHQRPLQVRCEPDDQAQPEPRAALLLTAPILGHACCPSLLNRQLPSSTGAAEWLARKRAFRRPSGCVAKEICKSMSMPGSTLCRNLALTMLSSVRGLGNAARIASSMASSNTTPGTMGRPGKCPSRLG